MSQDLVQFLAYNNVFVERVNNKSPKRELALRIRIPHFKVVSKNLNVP